jgi:hypothetical protein
MVVHLAQLLTYPKLSGRNAGLLMSVKTEHVKPAIITMVNEI